MEESKIEKQNGNIRQYNVSSSALSEFLEENLQKSRDEKWQNEMFGAGWIAALMHVKVNFLEQIPCPNCKETKLECACMRNKCIRCQKPVGNITFTVCDECWDKA